MKLFATVIFFFSLSTKATSQVVIIYPIGQLTQAIVPEHGFLPGKKFQFYPTIEPYDFSGMKMRIELFDNRENLKLKTTNCSPTVVTNESEFTGGVGVATVYKYYQQIFSQSGIQIDTLSDNILKVELEVLDSRLIGVGKITAHGLCQMKMTFKNIVKIYCVDITDKDKHSPISSNAFVTRKTGTRVITSAAIREVIEQFLKDLKYNSKT